MSKWSAKLSRFSISILALILVALQLSRRWKNNCDPLRLFSGLNNVVMKLFSQKVEEPRTPHLDEVAVTSLNDDREPSVRKLQAAFRAHRVKRSQSNLGDSFRSASDEACLLAPDTLEDAQSNLGDSAEFGSASDEVCQLAQVTLEDSGSREVEASQIVYCDEESREKHAASEIVIVVDGKHRLQLNNAKLQEEPQEKMIFVIGSDETLYVHPKIKGKFHHISFLAGAPVQVAGKIGLDADRCVVWVEPKSGHYQPGLPELETLADRWSRLGLDLTTINWVKPSKWRDAWPFNEEGVYTNLQRCEGPSDI